MPKPSLTRLILVPALLTLAVTLLRLAGELLQWSSSLFNRDAGGGGALVGIVWLIPVFGVYFALRLDQAGEGPASVGQAVGWAGLALVLNALLAFAAFTLLPSPVAQLGVFAITSWLAILLASRGWAQLWRVLLAYGLAARIPIVIIMFLSIFGAWDTHYSKPRPDFPAMGSMDVFLWTALLPQLSIWIFLTVVGGMIFGALAIGLERLMRKPAAASAAS
jgi:hypothetical protein